MRVFWLYLLKIGKPLFIKDRISIERARSFGETNLYSKGGYPPIPHLSTPTGPPVFTSPVRPAAVPFRTSPATPESDRKLLSLLFNNIATALMKNE